MTNGHPPSRKGIIEPDDALVEALLAAHEPGRVDPELNDALVEKALARLSAANATGFSARVSEEDHDSTADHDELAPVDDEEQADAALLSRALIGDGAHPLLELADSLRAAHAPSKLDDLRSQVILKRALETARSKVHGRVWTYAALVSSMAAGFTLWLATSHGSKPVDEGPTIEPLALSRSAAPLFVESYGQGSTTDRIDRIYAVRSRELRHNRYATWRVR